MIFRERTWVYLQPEQAVDRIHKLRKRKSISGKVDAWLLRQVHRSVKHLAETNFSDSHFLKLLGISAESPVVVISQDVEGSIFIEYLVACSDGTFVGRQEALDMIPFLPTPNEIFEECLLIRAARPVCGYNDQWVGVDGPRIRDIPLEGIAILEDTEC